MHTCPFDGAPNTMAIARPSALAAQLARCLASTALAGLATATQAQQSQAPESAPVPAQMPQASALVQRFQSFLIAYNGNGALPPDSLAPQFAQQLSLDQIQKILAGLRGNVGGCQAVGRMQGSDAAGASFLLHCEKGYMPVSINIESQAPFRITGLLIQPTFWK